MKRWSIRKHSDTIPNIETFKVLFGEIAFMDDKNSVCIDLSDLIDKFETEVGIMNNFSFEWVKIDDIRYMSTNEIEIRFVVTRGSYNCRNYSDGDSIRLKIEMPTKTIELVGWKLIYDI